METTSPTSGQLVRLTVSPAGVIEVEPTTAVVPLINPEDLTQIRSSFCNPAIWQLWRNAWEQFVPFLDYPRRVVALSSCEAAGPGSIWPL